MADRSDFYYEQEVTHAEMDQAFDDMENADRNQVVDQTVTGTHATAAWGVCTGLEVTERSGTPDLNVEIADGVAYDEQGRRIPHTGGPTLLDLTATVPGSNSRYVRIYAEFTRVLTDPRTDGLGAAIDYRQSESVLFSYDAGTIAASPVKPAVLANKVLLATVLLTSSHTVIVDADISMDLPDLSEPAGDRQEGGYIVHSRVLPARRKIRFDVSPVLGGEEVIDLGTGNHLQMRGGTLRMAPVGSDGGNSVFGELASIYKASQVRVAGTIQDGGGYWYSNPTSDEYGEPLQAIGKVLSYDPGSFTPAGQNVTPQSTTPAGNIWRMGVFGTRPVQGPAWVYNASGTNAYAWPLFCPLPGIPFRSQLVDFEWEMELHTVVATLTFGVSVYRRGIDPTDLTMITNGGAVSLSAPGIGLHQLNAGTLSHLARPDLYTYYAAFWIYITGAQSSIDAGIYVTGCRLEYEIREASGEYYHPTL